MKTIFITSFHGHISRNILDAGVLRRLSESGDLRIVILVPAYKADYFREHFSNEGVIIEGVKPYRAARAFSGLFFKRLSRALLPGRTPTGKRRYKFYWDRKWPHFLAGEAAGILGRSFFLRRLVRALDLAWSPKGLFDTLLDRHRPAVIFATDAHNDDDVSLMQDARRRGIPIVGMWRSWDNPTQQTLRVFPDRLLVGSEELAKETTILHYFPKKRLVITGHPHYDRYIRGPVSSREEFFRRWGLDPEKRLILFAPAGDKVIRFNDLDQHVMELLADADANVLVRFPPGEDVRLVDFHKPPQMAIDKPGFRFAGHPGECEIRREDDDNLIDALYQCDVLITGPTSLPLDAALADKPIIIADVYPTPRHRYEKGWGFLLDHIKKLIATGGVRYVSDRTELVRAIDAYFENPKLHAEGRARIRALWHSHADGRAGERVADAILGFLEAEKRQEWLAR